MTTEPAALAKTTLRSFYTEVRDFPFASTKDDEAWMWGVIVVRFYAPNGNLHRTIRCASGTGHPTEPDVASAIPQRTFLGLQALGLTYTLELMQLR